MCLFPWFTSICKTLHQLCTTDIMPIRYVAIKVLHWVRAHGTLQTMPLALLNHLYVLLVLFLKLLQLWLGGWLGRALHNFLFRLQGVVAASSRFCMGWRQIVNALNGAFLRSFLRISLRVLGLVNLLFHKIALSRFLICWSLLSFCLWRLLLLLTVDKIHVLICDVRLDTLYISRASVLRQVSRDCSITWLSSLEVYGEGLWTEDTTSSIANDLDSSHALSMPHILLFNYCLQVWRTWDTLKTLFVWHLLRT